VSRSSLPTVAVVAVAAGLLLSACGGGGSSNSDKIIKSSTAPAPTSASPEPTASPVDTVKRPATTLPKDFKVTFDWPSTGDATKDAVLHDAEQYVLAYNRASALDSTKDPAYQFYSRDQGLTYARAQIDANIQGGYAPTGLDAYYRATVTVLGSGRASVTYCEDESRAYSKETKTGKVDITTPDDSAFVFYNTLFVKDAVSNGVWQASHVVVTEKAVSQCKR
jgi:hypothetical protein